MIKRETGVKITTKSIPTPNEILKSAPKNAASLIESVDDEICSHFVDQASSFVEEHGVLGVAKALAFISGLKDFKKRSLLTFSEGFSTLLVKSSFSVPLREGDVTRWLQDIGISYFTFIFFFIFYFFYFYFYFIFYFIFYYFIFFFSPTIFQC